MTDRDTAIQALTVCAAGTNSCEKCPMKDNCKGVSNAAMAAAIKLLKAQEESERRIEEKLEQIVPPIEGDPGADFDLGCRQGLKFALKTLREGSQNGPTVDLG